jgi:hypothetical protein
MEIKRIEIIDMSKFGKTAKGLVYCIHIKISDIESHAKEIINSISDTSWIKRLGVIEQKSYNARALQTINKLVTEIFEKVESVVSQEFGEYLVSISAKDTLKNNLDHKDIPLSELWKEKISGNPGFDFHTESPTKLISFGEAKYSSSSNPHSDAVNQIVGFIQNKKDEMELIDLKYFTSKEAIENALDEKKGFVAAFSINGKQYDRIFNTILKSDDIDPLLDFPEFYLIGVEI